MAHPSGFLSSDVFIFQGALYQFDGKGTWTPQTSGFITVFLRPRSVTLQEYEVMSIFAPRSMLVVFTGTDFCESSTYAPATPAQVVADRLTLNYGTPSTSGGFYETQLRDNAIENKGKLRRIEDFKNNEFGFELNIGLDTFIGTGKSLESAAEACHKDLMDWRKRMGKS